MDIKVIGAGCDKCDTLYANVCLAAAELGLDADITKVEDLIEIVKLGVMTAPSLMVDGKVVVSGQILSCDKLVKLLKKL